MNRIKTAIFNFITRHLFNGFTEGDIITFNEKQRQFYFKGNIMSEQDVDNMIKTLKLLDLNDGYNYLLSDMEYRASEKLFMKSNIIDDMIFAKSALWVVDILRKRKDQLLDQYEQYENARKLIQNRAK